MDLSARISRVWASVERWLDRDRIRFLCWGLLVVTVLLMVISFATSDENHQTRFGSLGEDFAGFYYAGKILNGPTPEKLYDPVTQDEAYFEIFPTLRPDQDRPGRNLPYVHPPLIAFVFRPLARLPYPTAYAIWLLISACLYGAGLVVTWRVMPSIPRGDRIVAILLALTFEPFLMECWLGGQLSAFAFLCMALAFYWEETGRPILSGLALGLCLYKPTLVLLLLPMLVVGRRWWTLMGVCLTALALALLSLLTVGAQLSFGYIDALLGFSGTATGTGMERKDWKFVDLNFFFRNLFGEPTLLGKILVMLIAAGPLIFLFISWWRMGWGDKIQRRLLWASTVTWTMVINVYMGAYDMILVALALLWTAEVFYRPGNRMEADFPTFKFLVFLVIVLSWITQRPVAELTGFQIITPVLFAVAAFQLRLAWKRREMSAASAQAAELANA
jgi:Glycosyltransferase family 87